MSARLTIALDAMGGDAAPSMVVWGANIARQRYPETNFLMFGREPEITPLLNKLTKLKAVTTVVRGSKPQALPRRLDMPNAARPAR